jgi:hypothetical protein
LPQALFALRKEIDKAIGFIAEVSNPESPGQRRRVQQNSTGPGKAHRPSDLIMPD